MRESEKKTAKKRKAKSSPQMEIVKDNKNVHKEIKAVAVDPGRLMARTKDTDSTERVRSTKLEEEY